MTGELSSDRYREPGERERDAVQCAIDHLGGCVYTRRDATRVLLGYADITTVDGRSRPGPLAQSERWRQSFALKFALALRGVL